MANFTSEAIGHQKFVAQLSMLQIADETAICHHSHNSSNWDSHITRQLGYKHTFCQNVLSTEKLLLLIFAQKPNIHKCWCV